jgi:serine/threonine protein kinase
MVVGTPRYMSPEQIAGEDPGPACDLYAVGVILGELSTGRVLWEGGSYTALAAQKLEPSPVLDQIPDPLRELVGRLLACRVADRPATAARVRDALRPLVGDHEAPAAPVAPVAPVAPAVRPDPEAATEVGKFVTLARPPSLPRPSPSPTPSPPRASSFRPAPAPLSLVEVPRPVPTTCSRAGVRARPPPPPQEPPRSPFALAVIVFVIGVVAFIIVDGMRRPTPRRSAPQEWEQDASEAGPEPAPGLLPEPAPGPLPEPAPVVEPLPTAVPAHRAAPDQPPPPLRNRQHSLPF